VESGNGPWGCPLSRWLRQRREGAEGRRPSHPQAALPVAASTAWEKSRYATRRCWAPARLRVPSAPPRERSRLFSAAPPQDVQFPEPESVFNFTRQTPPKGASNRARGIVRPPPQPQLPHAPARFPPGIGPATTRQAPGSEPVRARQPHGSDPARAPALTARRAAPNPDGNRQPFMLCSTCGHGRRLFELGEEWDCDSDVLRAHAARRLLGRAHETAWLEPAEFYFSRNFETSAAFGRPQATVQPMARRKGEGRQFAVRSPSPRSAFASRALHSRTIPRMVQPSPRSAFASRALHSRTIPRMVLEWSG